MSTLSTPLPRIGRGLNRPESVIATADGRIYACDKLRGVARVGEQEYPGVAVDWPVADAVPNGIALMQDGSFLIANVGPQGGLWRLTAPGKVESLFASQMPASPLNFAFPDDKGRIWLSFSTKKNPRELGFRRTGGDSTIGLIDAAGKLRIVAEGLGWSNELRVDPTGRWLYVNETFARRLSRFEIAANGDLGKRETVCNFDAGTWPDGLEFDEHGDVWLTGIISNRIIHVAADGTQTVHLEDCADDAMAQAEQAFDEDRLGWNEIGLGKNYSLGSLSSLAFGGEDLRTVYLGSLGADAVSVWRAPVAGEAPLHWHYGSTVID